MNNNIEMFSYKEIQFIRDFMYTRRPKRGESEEYYLIMEKMKSYLDSKLFVDND